MGEARRLYRVTVLGESEPREKRDVVTPVCPVCAPPVRLCTWADVSRFPLGTARPAWTTSCRRPSLIPPYPRRPNPGSSTVPGMWGFEGESSPQSRMF